MIRKNESNPCPFGLPIPEGCSKAGDSITEMQEGKKNRLVDTGEECAFNAQCNKEQKFVNCNFGEATQGLGNFSPAHASPLYPRLWEGFNTINLDRQYHNYKDFSWFSLYGSRNHPLSKRADAYAPCKMCGIQADTETLCTHEEMCLQCFEGREKGHDWLGDYEDPQGKIGKKLSYRDRTVIAQARVIETIEPNPETIWTCPHCENKIHEKSMFYDMDSKYGSVPEWYHRPCMEKGSIVLPTQAYASDSEWVPNPLRKNFDYGSRQGALMI